MSKRGTRPTRMMLILVLLLAACSYYPTAGQTVPPLVVLSNATDVRRTTDYDGAVKYVVRDPYPGSVTISLLSKALAAAKWDETTESPLAVGIEKRTRTWWTYEDEPDTKVYQWEGSWKNANGDFITYVLRYEVSPPNAVAQELKVFGIFTTAETTARLRKQG